MGGTNWRGQNLDEGCATCGHAFREHADGPCMWLVLKPSGHGVDDCGCRDFASRGKDVEVPE